jgi:hypothetical protein
LSFKTDSVAPVDKQNSEEQQVTGSEARTKSTKTKSMTSSYTSKGQTDLKTVRNQQIADRNKLISESKKKTVASRANQATRQPTIEK